MEEEKNRALTETYLALQQRNVDRSIVAATQRTNTLLSWIIFILLLPYTQYISDLQFSKIYCDRYDNNLATKLDCALKSPIARGIDISVSQVTMSLRGSVSGLWRFVYFGIGTVRTLVPRAIQFMCVSKAPYKDSTLRESFADPDTAATMIRQVMYNSQNTGQTESVFMLVCNALEIDEKVCNPEDAELCDDATKSGVIEGASTGIMNALMVVEGMSSSNLGKNPKMKMAAGGIAALGATIGLSVASNHLEHCT